MQTCDSSHLLSLLCTRPPTRASVGAHLTLTPASGSDWINHSLSGPSRPPGYTRQERRWCLGWLSDSHAGPLAHPTAQCVLLGRGVACGKTGTGHRASLAPTSPGLSRSFSDFNTKANAKAKTLTEGRQLPGRPHCQEARLSHLAAYGGRVTPALSVTPSLPDPWPPSRGQPLRP